MSRSNRELAHGEILAKMGPESIWGWESPAGQIRAKRRGKMIIDGARLKPGVHALELGCGTGLFTEMFSTTGAHITALDISEELLGYAFARNLSPDRICFIKKPLETCEFDSLFDSVIGSSILHHLDIDTALVKIFHLLKRGGIMCFTEPNMLNPQIFIQKNIPWIKKSMGDSPDETAFIRWRLQSLLSNIGFINIEVKPFDWLHPATPEKMIKQIQSIGRLLEKAPILREFSGSLYIRSVRP